MSAVLAVGAEEALPLSERKHLLDAVWLLTFCATLVAAALPWFLRSADLDFAPAAWAAFLSAGLYLVTAAAADRLSDPRFQKTAVWVLQLAALLLLTLLWHLLGGIENPLFLLPFVLPVAASGLVLIGWLPYASALTAIAAVTAVTLLSTPELAWYLQQLGLPAVGAVRSLALPGTADPFPAAYLPPSFLFATLVIFAVALLALALVADSVGTLLSRLYVRLASSSRALSHTSGLFEQAFAATPAPAVLVHADNVQVVRASNSFLSWVGLTEAELAGRSLFDLVDLAAPEEVAALLGSGGEIPVVSLRAGGRDRLVRMRLAPVSHDGARHALASFEQLGDGFYLEAAARGVREAILVLDPQRRVVFANPAAGSLLDLPHPRCPVPPQLEPALPEPGWGATERPATRLGLGGRHYRVEASAGPSADLTLVVLRPEAPPA